MSAINSFFYKSAIILENIYANYKNAYRSAGENQNLKQQIANLAAQIAELKFFEQENQTLKKNLKFLRDKNYNYIGARIFVQNFDSANRILIIDRGINDGVKKDLPVISEEGIFIGVVEKAEPSHSLIKLLSDNLSQISVLIENQSRSMGLLKGGYNLGMRVELVPQGEIIEEGDLVVSSGLDENIPAGLLVGYVESLKSNPHEPFQTVFIKSAVDYSKITTAAILTEVR